jgi:hypothetical protein
MALETALTKNLEHVGAGLMQGKPAVGEGVTSRPAQRAAETRLVSPSCTLQRSRSCRIWMAMIVVCGRLLIRSH